MDNPEQLEKFINDKLRQLPEREAPADIAGNVLARIAAQAQQPWWKQPFTQWPTGVQRMLFAFLTLILAAVSFAAWSPAEKFTLPALVERAGSLWSSDSVQSVASFLGWIGQSITWKTFAITGIVFVSAYALCLAAGLALWRVTKTQSHA